MERQFGRKVLLLTVGDITKAGCDVVVNAANAQLIGGGGVDGAIHRVGGPSIVAELAVIRKERGGCPTGSAVATSAGALPAKFVFHAVGPVYRDGKQGEPELLASCYRTVLEMAEVRGLASIAFPSISTGAYGYPLTEAATIAVRAVADHLSRDEGTVTEATFVLFDQETLAAYERALRAFGS